MAPDLRGETGEHVPTRLTAVIDRALPPETRASYDSDAFFSQLFIRRHTEFESLSAFCQACPCERDTIGGVQELPADDRDDFVAATTEFETWEEMKERAALAELVTLATV
jgi:hypothetical protein